MKEPKPLTSGFERTCDILIGTTNSPAKKDAFVSSDQEKKSPLEADEKISSDKATKAQRDNEIKKESLQDTNTTIEKDTKTSAAKKKNKSKSKRDARYVERGGHTYFPTNMLMRVDLHKALKIAAIEKGVPEYEILNRALEIHLRALKKEYTAESRE